MRHFVALAGVLLLVSCTDSGSTPAEPLLPSMANGLRPSQFNSGPTPVDVGFSCGAFEVSLVGTEQERNTGFFDDQGVLLIVNAHIKTHLVYTNLSTGKTLANNQSYHFVVDFRTGAIETDTGKFFNVKTGGVRIRDVGRFQFDQLTGEILFQAGPHDIGLGSSRPLVCEALA